MYDSTDDTKAHIERVQELVMRFCSESMMLARGHDLSKLSGEEKDTFDKFTPKLADSTYGSDEYKAFLESMKPALEHHYAYNSHHPEHYKDGIDGMTLFDIIEMFCDWKASTERHKNGDLSTSIVKNIDRFKISQQLARVFENTRRRLGW